MTKSKTKLATAPAAGAIDLSNGVSDAEAALAGKALAARRVSGSAAVSAETEGDGGAGPVAPDQLVSTGVSETEIELTWQNHAVDAGGVLVERSSDGESDWIPIAEMGAEGTTYLDGELTPGAVYAYRVIAYNEAGEACSEVVWATTTLPAEPPIEPEPIVPPVEPPIEPEPIGPPPPDRIPIEALEEILAANAAEIERLQAVKQVIYTGPRMAVLGNRIILEGETRAVTQHELDIVEERRPGEFQIVADEKPDGQG
jgi:hypothetical protein